MRTRCVGKYYGKFNWPFLKIDVSLGNSYVVSACYLQLHNSIENLYLEFENTIITYLTDCNTVRAL